MKTSENHRRKAGFTLIELLVVITIVAVLAAMSFAGVNIALKKARTTEGIAAASALSSAVNQFYSEYGYLPDLPGLAAPQGGPTSQGDGVRLLQIMLAQEGTGGDIENRRQIPFLNTKEGKNGARRGGLFYGTGGNQVQGMYDPFGQPYTVLLNLNYDNVMNFQLGNRTYNLRGDQVAVYSAGADGELGTVDDITSFQR